MNNTQIYLWIEPMIMNHQRCSGKVFFNCIIDGNYKQFDCKEVEDVISGGTMDSIMDFANIDSNWNYGVISTSSTNKKPSIEFDKSPEEKDTANKIAKVVRSKKPITITKENVEIKDKGIIEISFPDLKLKDKIDFSKIWNTLEKNFIGKIKEGDKVSLKDDDGNIIFEMIGGSFLNIGLADMKVYDTKKKNPNPSIFTEMEGLKGGLFIRDDGSMSIGDMDRTFFLTIHTNNLLKASLKLNKSMSELATIKLLK